MLTFQSNTVTLNGVNIFYKVYDTLQADATPSKKEAIPVIFHHGWTSSSAAWNRVIPHLQEDYLCITFDCRGCGQSGRPEESEAYTIQQYARDVIALADHLNINKFIYVGHSMGGCVGMELAIEFPERLHKLVLVTPAPSFGLKDAPGINEYHEQNCRDRKDPHALDRLVNEALLTAVRPYPKEELIESMKNYLNVSEGHFEGSWTSLLNFNVSDKLRSVTIPTLMIAAQCDLLMKANIDDYFRFPNASLHVFSRVSHSITREIPSELAALLRDFFEHGVMLPPDLRLRMMALEQPTSQSTTDASNTNAATNLNLKKRRPEDPVKLSEAGKKNGNDDKSNNNSSSSSNNNKRNRQTDDIVVDPTPST